jgi:hypothetical protein
VVSHAWLIGEDTPPDFYLGRELRFIVKPTLILIKNVFPISEARATKHVETILSDVDTVVGSTSEGERYVSSVFCLLA